MKLRFYKIGLIVFTTLCGSFVRAQQYSYVDMGMSVLWASANIGASQPSDNGDFYAWGETYTKKKYGFPQYKYYSWLRYTKYGNVDGIMELDSLDDVAKMKWKNGWRMPSRDELQCLLDSTTYTKQTINGRQCLVLTSRINGHTLIIPIAGDIGDEGKHNYENVYFFLWSKTISSTETLGLTDHAYVLRYYNVIGSLASLEMGEEFRYRGFSVRAVRDIATDTLHIYPYDQTPIPSAGNICLQVNTNFSSTPYIHTSIETRYVWLKAESSGCVEFQQWSDGSRENPRRVLLNKNTILPFAAQFVPRQVTVTLHSSDSNEGQVQFLE